MDHVLFCANHPEKIAKRHCNKCNQDICNECVFESHIEHHSEVNKIEYNVENKSELFSRLISDDIQSIVDNTLQSLKPQIYKMILEKTKQYVDEHKNLQLKVSGASKESKKESYKPYQPHYEIKSAGPVAKGEGKSLKPDHIQNSFGKIADMKKIFERNKK